MLNRELAVPQFTASEAGGVLSITTAEVKLTYAVGKGGFEGSLAVAPVDPSASTFPGWAFGDPSPGNLLGTIRGLDQQGSHGQETPLGYTPLNCTRNALILDNGEYNHCEWGLVSRDGWAVYEDERNAALDANYWWDNSGMAQPRACAATSADTDVAGGIRSNAYSGGANASSIDECCAVCKGDPTCTAYVFDPDTSDTPNCWPLASYSFTTAASGRTLGQMEKGPLGPQFNVDRFDRYGFFHGLDFRGALKDYSEIGGKTAMVLRAASGVWWSRWFDINNAGTRGIIEDYESRGKSALASHPGPPHPTHTQPPHPLPPPPLSATANPLPSPRAELPISPRERAGAQRELWLGARDRRLLRRPAVGRGPRLLPGDPRRAARARGARALHLQHAPHRLRVGGRTHRAHVL